MRFSIDAHAIGCHLTGNEVYIRNLLCEFARLDRANEFIACISHPSAPAQIPEGIGTRWVSSNPYKRLGMDLSLHVGRDRLARVGLVHVLAVGAGDQ